MSSNYPAILEGVRARLAVMVGVPTYSYDPMVYPTHMHIRIIGARGTPLPAASQERGKRWTFTAWLIVRYTDNETAEQQIAAKIPALDDALVQDLDAGGSLGGSRDGQADIGELIWRSFTVGQTRYRAVEFTIAALEFYPTDYEL